MPTCRVTVDEYSKLIYLTYSRKVSPTIIAIPESTAAN